MSRVQYAKDRSSLLPKELRACMNDESYYMLKTCGE